MSGAAGTSQILCYCRRNYVLPYTRPQGVQSSSRSYQLQSSSAYLAPVSMRMCVVTSGSSTLFPVLKDRLLGLTGSALHSLQQHLQVSQEIITSGPGNASRLHRSHYIHYIYIRGLEIHPGSTGVTIYIIYTSGAWKYIQAPQGSVSTLYTHRAWKYIQAPHSISTAIYTQEVHPGPSRQGNHILTVPPRNYILAQLPRKYILVQVPRKYILV